MARTLTSGSLFITFLILASGSAWCLKSSSDDSATLIVCCQNLNAVSWSSRRRYRGAHSFTL